MREERRKRGEGVEMKRAKSWAAKKIREEKTRVQNREKEKWDRVSEPMPR